MIFSIKMVQNGDYVRTVEFNVPGSDSSPVFVLKDGTALILFSTELPPGEYINKVCTRTGKIFDRVEFHTSFGRVYSCGGTGGEDYTVFQGKY
jgi:hypothetical protein